MAHGLDLGSPVGKRTEHPGTVWGPQYTRHVSPAYYEPSEETRIKARCKRKKRSKVKKIKVNKRNPFAVHAWNKGHPIEPNKKAKQSKQVCRENKGDLKNDRT
tara:strand:- start:478 stop:786 length:309 start_codon:yes stop_codon:yes gene_type:complete